MLDPVLPTIQETLVVNLLEGQTRGKGTHNRRQPNDRRKGGQPKTEDQSSGQQHPASAQSGCDPEEMWGYEKSDYDCADEKHQRFEQNEYDRIG